MQEEAAAGGCAPQPGEHRGAQRAHQDGFPGRVTDHRIGLTLYKLDLVVDGDLDEIIEALITADQVERLKETADIHHG